MLDNRAMTMIQSPSAQREQMEMQQQYANLQILQNVALSNVLFDDEKQSGPSGDAKTLRAAAKAKLTAFINGLEMKEKSD